MTVVINGTTGITNVNGSAAAPAETGATTNTGLFFPTTNVIGFSNNGAETMRLDASGNLGLGTTPSAWSATYRSLQLGLSTVKYFSISSNSTSACEGNLLWNAYSTGNETFAYITTGDVVTRFRQSGDFTWSTAPSGTAGGAISFVDRMKLDSSGNVGIGTSSPSTYGTFAVQTQTTNAPTVAITGSSLSPKLNHFINDSTSVLRNLNQIQFNTGSSDISNYQGYMTFSTMGSAGGTISERMRIDATGNVLVTNVAGLGYGTGSGGTVTQATSKGTGVTLNKPAGQITMNNAALAAGATATFLFTNSLIATQDVLALSLGSGDASGTSYQVWVSFQGSGSAYINLKNTSGGSRSEAIIINFAVIKVATS